MLWRFMANELYRCRMWLSPKKQKNLRRADGARASDRGGQMMRMRGLHISHAPAMLHVLGVPAGQAARHLWLLGRQQRRAQSKF